MSTPVLIKDHLSKEAAYDLAWHLNERGLASMITKSQDAVVTFYRPGSYDTVRAHEIAEAFLMNYRT